MVGIYKITNPKGNIYVGQSIKLETRITYYEKNLVKSQPKIYRSIQKYGWENHKWEIIEECAEGELNQRERYWQEHYDVLSERGLNCRLTETDDKSGYLSEEMRKNIAEGMKGVNAGENSPCFGKPLSEEHRKKVSEALRGENHPMFSKKHSEESRKKMSESKTGENHPLFGKTGENHPRFGKTLSEKSRKKISEAMKGEKHPFFGKTHSEENKKKISESKKGVPAKNRRTVLQIDLDGNIVKEWESVTHARNELNIKGIANVVTGKAKTSGGFYWKYKN